MFLRVNELKLGIIISNSFDNTSDDGFRVDLFPPVACDFAHVDDQVVSGQGFTRHSAGRIPGQVGFQHSDSITKILCHRNHGAYNRSMEWTGIGRFVLRQSNVVLFTSDHGIVVEGISGHG